jgi:putative endonuclease
LVKRIYEHKIKFISSFTSRYKVDKLVYYEMFNGVMDAIKREKQLKGGSRQRKIDLIQKKNPGFDDLCSRIVG